MMLCLIMWAKLVTGIGRYQSKAKDQVFGRASVVLEKRKDGLSQQS